MKKLPLLFVFLIACSSYKSESVLSPQAFKAQYKVTEDAILLDVRTPEEVATGKIDGAENIVWDASFGEKLSNLEHKPIFVYCGSGIRSAKAAAVLKEKGFEVYELDGGIKAWRAAGMPVE